MLENHKYNEINATIIADSKDVRGNRITTFVITFPRIVLAEFNTHRMLSKNSASSRAIPFKKMFEKVQNDPFVPIRFQEDHKGMQGTKYLEGRNHDLAVSSWLRARTSVLEEAIMLNRNNKVTKQICNRLLEPWGWHTAITTATEWENFYALRHHPQAEIHIAKLAECMLDAANASTPVSLSQGEWHIPFGDDLEEALSLYYDDSNGNPDRYNEIAVKAAVEDSLIKVATARCARVSYMNFDGTNDFEADIKLHDRLASMGHWSPFEHCARAMDSEEYYILDEEDLNNCSYAADRIESLDGWSGNFRGFTQYRKMFIGENKKDSRLIKK
ncbi:MAG: hypothetical protein CMC35_02990 [Flavobacteriaceae bacterium]|nr:hypothetical protein [Flavobacteriaceae bacterium]|tara:strand:+ start:605 stop:1591 length:987 start_codon:yes stop_codon:yes gene_type:complete